MRYFDLFCGIGGFSLGLKPYGHKCVGACEIDRYARAVYTGHFPKTPIWQDATKIRPEQLPDFDILCAGFPCQAFSVAGKRLGFEESRGTLFFEIIRIAKQKRPRLLLFENVRGLLSHDKGRTFATILAALDEVGYDAQWQVLNSKYFVPQNRERIFIIANLRGADRPKVFPLREDAALSAQEEKAQQKVEVCSTLTAGYSKMGLGSQTYVVAPCLTVGGHSGGLHSDMMVIIHDKSQGNRVYDPKGVSQTLSANGGGWGAKTGLYQLKNKKIRRLTPTECERLQGFPDGWTEGISDTQRYKCLGNAVTVPVIKFIAKKLEECHKK